MHDFCEEADAFKVFITWFRRFVSGIMTSIPDFLEINFTSVSKVDDDDEEVEVEEEVEKNEDKDEDDVDEDDSDEDAEEVEQFFTTVSISNGSNASPITIPFNSLLSSSNCFIILCSATDMFFSICNLASAASSL